TFYPFAFVFLVSRRPATSSLFPYTTLFRSPAFDRRDCRRCRFRHSVFGLDWLPATTVGVDVGTGVLRGSALGPRGRYRLRRTSLCLPRGVERSADFRRNSCSRHALLLLRRDSFWRRCRGGLRHLRHRGGACRLPFGSPFPHSTADHHGRGLHAAASWLDVVPRHVRLIEWTIHHAHGQPRHGPNTRWCPSCRRAPR